LSNFDKGNTETDSIQYALSLFDPSITWKDVEWLKSITKLSIVLKGILTAEDALLALKCGADAILVSNHGVRQLDGVPSTVGIILLSK